MTFTLVLLVAALLYLTPTAIAQSRHKRNLMAIFALNLLLGWTMLGWVVALVWALTRDEPDTPPVIVYANQPPASEPEPPSGPAIG